MITIGSRIFLFPMVFLVTLMGLSTPVLVIMFCILNGILGFCWANISVAGSTIVSNICYKGFRAESTGMYNAFIGVATICGALIGGLVAEYMGYLPVFLTSSIFLAAALVLLWKTRTDECPMDDEGPECSHV